MNKSDIATLIPFNFWANNRILSACERISVDEFTRQHKPDPGWGSLRGIMVHTLDAEVGRRSVLQALDEDQILEEGDFVAAQYSVSSDGGIHTFKLGVLSHLD